MVEIKFEKHPAEKVKWRKTISLICLLVILFIPHFTSPEVLPLPECTFKSLTGYDCPTCGFTRSYYAITHGLIRDSFNYHYAGTLTCIGILFYIFKFTIEMITGWEIQIKLPARITLTYISLLGGSWLVWWFAKLFGEM
jgi:hypothetical protein